MLSFLNVAKKLNKKLAISLKQATYWMSWLNAETQLLQKQMKTTCNFTLTEKAGARALSILVSQQKKITQLEKTLDANKQQPQN